MALHASPVRLVGAGFEDLRCLAPLLETKRVVQLGEGGHGVAEFSLLKTRIIQYLHTELGFDVLAFESSREGCARADANAGLDTPLDVMRQALYAVWHSEETLRLFEYVDAARRAGRVLTLAGIDIRQDGRADAAAECERDRGMAANLDHLLDEVHPGRKFVVWAHNAHVGRRRDGAGPVSMGAWSAARRGHEIYTAALYMGAGRAADNRRGTYEIADPPPHTLEAALRAAGMAACFVDFSRAAADSPMRCPLVAREWGVRPIGIVPAEMYDGLFYVDRVTPPHYLPPA